MVVSKAPFPWNYWQSQANWHHIFFQFFLFFRGQIFHDFAIPLLFYQFPIRYSFLYNLPSRTVAQKNIIAINEIIAGSETRGLQVKRKAQRHEHTFTNWFQSVRAKPSWLFAFVRRSIVAPTIVGCGCGGQCVAPETVWREWQHTSPDGSCSGAGRLWGVTYPKARRRKWCRPPKQNNNCS